MTGNQLVWSEYNFSESTTVTNKRGVSAFLGYIVIGMGIFVDLEVFLLSSSVLEL